MILFLSGVHQQLSLTYQAQETHALTAGPTAAQEADQQEESTGPYLDVGHRLQEGPGHGVIHDLKVSDHIAVKVQPQPAHQQEGARQLKRQNTQQCINNNPARRW